MSETKRMINRHQAVFKPRTKKDDDDELSEAAVECARKTGLLNLSSRGLYTVPEKVWTVNQPTEEELKTLRFEFDRAEREDRWWEQESLKSLDLSSNSLTAIDSKIGLLAELNTLNLCGNKLQELPAEIGLLNQLRTFNASYNELRKLPDKLFNLSELRELNLRSNGIRELQPKIGDLIMLTNLDLSHNDLHVLPIGLGYLVRLIELDVSHNRLTELPPDIMSMRALRKLDASFNCLKDSPQLGELRKLQVLLFQRNVLTAFPDVCGCVALKELHLGGNNIAEIDVSSFEELQHLRMLNLSNNKIQRIPEETVRLINLEFLDISFNDISLIPLSLGIMPNLKKLAIDGNTVKNVRQDIIRCGTGRILKHLRQSMTDVARGPAESTHISSDFVGNPLPNRYSMKSTKLLSLAGRSMTEIPEEVIEDAKAAQVTAIDLSENKLRQLPDELSMVNSTVQLRLTSNRLSDIPCWLAESYVFLQALDLSRNYLQSLPTSLGLLKHLREVDISFNRYTELPECLYDVDNLEVLIAHDNRIKIIDVMGLEKLKRLATLNLSNNNIDRVPPELGNLTNIRTLLLLGNCFKQPRQAILTNSAEEILAYLRDRIAQ